MPAQADAGKVGRAARTYLLFTQGRYTRAMARTRGPGNLVARRPTTEARVDVSAHRSYAAMIDQELGGRGQGGYRAIDEGRPPSTFALMVRPLALFLFACLGFVIVLLLWLWQAGAFEQLKPDARPVATVSTSWMGAQQAASSQPPAKTDVAPETSSVARPAPVLAEAADGAGADTAEPDGHSPE